ncbi:membrane protein [Asanoa ishikariensis]|uniref:Intracellular septation protein A n=1 Tax=Asanoa ishikariensis TaxID=137265 RepID=A0A1H3RSB9_9ACTN|nr:DUF3159 domain-containing protein [Asanoa ishikariensis]GIF66916.1 membrane protein [Asanoa ishikariensis]SDZ28245.1 Protein of unknown function [Asanoa ishikariensis]
MTSSPRAADESTRDPDGEEPLPPFGEMVSQQLGGWRGLVESSIPVVVFVVVNIVWELNPALIASVGVALVIGGIRLAQRRPIRHAVNGLFGIGLGAVIAWRTGEARDFYLPGIIQSYVFAAALLISAAVRQPLVGWGWSVIMAGGKSDWREDRRLMRTFIWLTVVWAVVWILKVSAQAWLWWDKQDDLLGIARLVLGTPPYVLLALFTVAVVRRVTREQPQPPAVEGA